MRRGLGIVFVVPRDGRPITVRGDWSKDDGAGAVLRDVHRRSCKIFRGALGPDDNAAHRDHLHLDMGGYGIMDRHGICR